MLLGCSGAMKDIESAAPQATAMSRSVLLHLSQRNVNLVVPMLDPLESSRLNVDVLSAAAALVPADIESQAVNYRWDAKKAGAAESTDVQVAVNFYFMRDGVEHIALVGVVRKAGVFYVNHVKVVPRNGVEKIVLN